jgi:hypothetical protein
MRFVLLLFSVSTAIRGQALTVSPAKGAPGSEVGVEILLDSPSAKAPVTLQMDVVFPAQLLDAEVGRPEIGRAAKDSGKTIQCAATHKSYSYSCIVFGGQKPIPNGSIAMLRFKIRADARMGNTIIRVQNVKTITGDYKAVLKDAEGTLTIR